MKILFWCEPYMGLYKEILKELEDQGHDVTYIDEPHRAVSVYSKNFSITRILKKLYVEKTNYFEKYWRKRICEEKIFSDYYDVFFCVNGMSFHPILINHLKTINPNIKTSLYIWDSNKTFDYFRNVQYFDKAYSFDLYDVENFGNGKVNFLPCYWPKELEDFDGTQIKYGVFSVGSIHDDRLFIYKQVIKQLKNEEIPCFIKLVVVTIPVKSFDKVRKMLLRLFGKEIELDNYLVLTGQKQYSFVTSKYIEPLEMTHLMSQSKAVLDTDIEIQGGVTPRLIWAMASNKLVYTTNKNIVKFPFYDPKYFQIIDRHNPVLDLSKLDNAINPRNSVSHLRIDKWVKYFV